MAKRNGGRRFYRIRRQRHLTVNWRTVGVPDDTDVTADSSLTHELRCRSDNAQQRYFFNAIEGADEEGNIEDGSDNYLGWKLWMI